MIYKVDLISNQTCTDDKQATHKETQGTSINRRNRKLLGTIKVLVSDGIRNLVQRTKEIPQEQCVVCHNPRAGFKSTVTAEVLLAQFWGKLLGTGCMESSH